MPWPLTAAFRKTAGARPQRSRAFPKAFRNALASCRTPGVQHERRCLQDKINTGDFSEKLIETWVYTQIAAQAELTGGEWSLYHFRTHEGKELDLLLENRRGDLIAVELKGKDHARKTDFSAMDWFTNTIAKDRKVMKVVLCAGEEARIADDDHLVLPMCALWL